MKTDHELGLKIQTLLKDKGIETPFIESSSAAPNAKETIADSFTVIMKCLGLDLSDDSLKETPHRVAKMFVDEVFYGLDYKNFPAGMRLKNSMQYQSMLVESGIAVKSFCEHHFVPIAGTAAIAYIPKSHVIGLSKLNRITDFFSRRPQVQERLTLQIQEALQYILETDDVAVSITANHTCVSHRGILDDNAITSTTELRGAFYNDPATRAEFYAHVKKD